MPPRTSLLRRAAKSPTLRKLAVVIAIVLAYQIWLSVQAGGKVGPGVGADRDERGRFPVDVELGFAPERYHILRIQKHGRIAGTDGHVVHLRGVAPAGVDALAREYWIKRIEAPKRGS
ncbi:hypothetical protein E1287_17535 [Actinomadura sp. KC06]|uniref:hypothetical protein n=1 Tax=Actinomadura sp. KC06 TaxID=2530369 RepID=UPI0010518CFC|nr:hypothetical protein [Actinomadura sp. KC06]TDD34150.1 hypothetical protein E1287_17535 [Actinomadura sp. KC06]